MVEIRHDLALERCFISSGLGMNHSKGSSIIPYYDRKLASKVPRSSYEKN